MGPMIIGMIVVYIPHSASDCFKSLMTVTLT